MSRIDFNSFMNFCKGVEGQTLVTAGARARFVLSSAQPDHFTYHVLSTGNDRRVAKKWLVMVLDHYEEIKSLRPTYYSGMTWNASYTLALLELYLKHRANS